MPIEESLSDSSSYLFQWTPSPGAYHLHVSPKHRVISARRVLEELHHGEVAYTLAHVLSRHGIHPPGFPLWSSFAWWAMLCLLVVSRW